MKRVASLLSLVFSLSAVSFATSVDYSFWGSLGAHNATLTGNTRAGSSLTLTSPVNQLNSLSLTGTITLTTGSLVPTPNANVLAFSGGSITVAGPGSTLFHSTFSSGTITLLGGSNFSISGSLPDGNVFLTEKNGDIRGNAVVTAEPGTLGLLSIGLIGLGWIIRRQKRSLPHLNLVLPKH